MQCLSHLGLADLAAGLALHKDAFKADKVRFEKTGEQATLWWTLRSFSRSKAIFMRNNSTAKVS